MEKQIQLHSLATDAIHHHNFSSYEFSCCFASLTFFLSINSVYDFELFGARLKCGDFKENFNEMEVLNDELAHINHNKLKFSINHAVIYRFPCKNSQPSPPTPERT